MKLTDELFEIGKNSKKICTIVDEDYVLLTKTMPIVDKELDSYLSNLKKASEAGINLAYVEDYRLIEGTTHAYDNGISYTKGVFLEKRAHGKTMDGKTYFSLNGEEDVNKVVDEYLAANMIYLEELERRAQGNNEFYIKLVKDYLNLENFGLCGDPKPLNFFYDEKDGFTIIDPIPGNDYDFREFFPSYIIGAVYGYGRPFLYLEDVKLGLPKEMVDRYNKVYKVINEKIMIALKKNGIDEKIIIETFEKDAYKTSYIDKVMEKEEILRAINDVKSNRVGI